MKANLQRLLRLETRGRNDTRQMHILKGWDSADVVDQLTQLRASGVIAPGDGAILLTGYHGARHEHQLA